MKKRKITKNNLQEDHRIVKDFFFGMILLVIVQTIFMLGGLFIESKLSTPITGIPSAIGLTVVLLAGIYFYIEKRRFILLGSFVIAFISPLILFLIAMFGFMQFTSPHLYYSITYMASMIVIIWGYCIFKIYKNQF